MAIPTMTDGGTPHARRNLPTLKHPRVSPLCCTATHGSCGRAKDQRHRAMTLTQNVVGLPVEILLPGISRRDFSWSRSMAQKSRAGLKSKSSPRLARLSDFLRISGNAMWGLRPKNGCAVSIGASDISLAGIDSQEAAIARVEQHLRGGQEPSAPPDPLCHRSCN